MNRSPVSSVSKMAAGAWAGGLLALLGAIWLGLMAIELASASMGLGAAPGAAFWTERNMIGAGASVGAILVGLGVIYLSRGRREPARPHRRHHHRHTHGPATVSAARVDQHGIPATEADEAVSFDMDAANTASPLPQDTPGAPRQRARTRVRIKQRIRKTK